MTPQEAVQVALAVRQGQVKLKALPAEQQVMVRSVMARTSDAQFGRMAGAKVAKRSVVERGYPVRGLHD